jgi:peptide/nickel transport system substrate-binding protein
MSSIHGYKARPKEGFEMDLAPRGLSIVFAAVLAITACAPSQAPTASASPAPVAIKRGGTATIAFSVDPNHFDPHKGTTAQNFVSLVYDGLTEFKTGPDVPTGTHIIEPALAEKWEITPDGKTYTFTLRRGVKFHDIPPVSGRELTADDVAFSIERMLVRDAENIKRNLFDVIERVEVVDKHTVKLTLSQPFAPLLANLGTVFAAIVPRSDVNFKSVAIGTGPFILKEFQRQTKYVYEKNPAYWRNGADGNPLPYLDGFVQVIIADEGSRTSALRAGQLDFTDLLVDNLAQQLLQSNTALVSQRFPGNFSVMTRLNVKEKPLDDVRVRQAISLALDRQAIANALGGGTGIVNGPIPTALTDYALPVGELPNFKQDLAKAKQLLADAGHANGLKLTAVLLRSPQNRQVMLEAMQGQLKTVGIDLELQFVESADLSKRRVDRNYQLMGDNLTPSAEPDTYTYAEYHSKSSGNVGNYSDPALDQLLDKARATSDPAQRKQVLRDIQIKLAELQFIITTGDPYYHSVFHPYVKGFRFSFVNQRIPIKHVWLDK